MMVNKKRVLIFSTAYLPLVGGAELAVHELARRLPDYHFDLITARLRPDLPKQEQIGNVLVHRLGRGRSSDKFFLPWRGRSYVRHLFAQDPYGVIWSIMASQASILAAWTKKIFPQAALVLTLQEGDPEEHLRRYVRGNNVLYRLFIRPWHLQVFHRADHITVISQDLAARAKRHRGDVPITIIPNGVDLERFHFRGHLDEKHYFQKERTIITTSRLVEKNGLFDLVAAMAKLPPEVSLHIFGTGPDENRLRNLADEHDVTERVHFRGQVDHHVVVRELSRADVFVRPSLSEGLGNSFLEAMAVGVPIVGTPVGGIPDFLVPGETGWFCQPHQPETIAAQVRFILDPLNRDLVSRVVVRARQVIEERYDWNKLAKALDQVLANS